MKDEKIGFYLWTRGTRPEALPKEESARLLREYHKYGDKETREKLIYGHLGLVQSLILRYYNRYVAREDQINPSLEDLYEIGTEVLIKSIDKFDPDTFKFAFSTYYTHWLQSKINHVFEKGHSVKTKKSLDALLKDKFGDDSNKKESDKIPSTTREFDVLHDRLELEYIKKEILPLLSKYERDLFVAKFFQNKNQFKISEQLGRPQSSISRDIKDVQKKVLRMYLEGPTALDKELRGIKIDEPNLNMIQENIKLFEKYGREFLRQYFLPTLSPVEQKVFDATVLNYRGQCFIDLEETLGLGKNSFSGYRHRTLKKLENNVEKLKQLQAEGKLPKPWKPTLKQTQEINRNERYIDQYGGRFFLQKYFVPSLAPLQRKIFECGVLEFEGQSKTEISQKLGITLGCFSTILKKTKEKLANTNFETLVDLMDNKSRLSGDATTEKQIELEQVERRKQLVAQYGGKEKLSKYFLPILPEGQRQVFDLLYIKQAFSTLSGVAEYLKLSDATVLKVERVCLQKLESTNLEELETIDKMAEEYLAKSHSQLAASRNNSLRPKIISEYGGIAFLRDVFLPQIITQADREIFEGVILEGQPLKNFAHLFSYDRKKYSPSYVDQVDEQGILTRIRQRIKSEILPQLENFKTGFEDFDKTVKDFYVKRGFEQIHPEDFEKMAFEEVEKITTLSQKQEKKPFITPELVEKAGGEQVLMRKFRSTLSLSQQIIFMKAYIDKMTDKQIADDMQLSLSNVGYAKKTIVEKLEAFAGTKTSKSTNNKQKS